MRNELAHEAREREANAPAAEHKIPIGTTLSGFYLHGGCLQTGVSKETQDMGEWKTKIWIFLKSGRLLVPDIFQEQVIGEAVGCFPEQSRLRISECHFFLLSQNQPASLEIVNYIIL
ncbi:hypothetical protein [Gracilimonas mengyeensis]|uniref:Uncharacterized protein n=1 Tax=Gracilimonas mengyeensis TaxID=1302730 RepID=A0A521BCB9_9BACT|nr:hypothetical protein [Gracilimonas mengyeensis]SMO44611.1 hypothetical protein SAMN06265219_102166 [Gracilimonas mengyeensis]